MSKLKRKEAKGSFNGDLRPHVEARKARKRAIDVDSVVQLVIPSQLSPRAQKDTNQEIDTGSSKPRKIVRKEKDKVTHQKGVDLPTGKIQTRSKTAVRGLNEIQNNLTISVHNESKKNDLKEKSKSSKTFNNNENSNRINNEYHHQDVIERVTTPVFIPENEEEELDYIDDGIQVSVNEDENEFASDYENSDVEMAEEISVTPQEQVALRATA